MFTPPDRTATMDDGLRPDFVAQRRNTRPRMDTPISEELLTTPVFGNNLKSDTFRGNLAEDQTLLVLLRHFGCLFCREMVADLRQVASKQAPGSSILFFYQATVVEGREFFAEHWPSAQAIADGSLKFYRAFGIPKSSLGQMIDPALWRQGMKSLSKGHLPGLPQGDVMQMPGLLLARRERIVWRHDFEHAGDHPKFGNMSLFGGPTEYVTLQQ